MIQGSIVAMVTPMKGAGEIDLDALRNLIDFHVQQGSDGIVAVGTTGESATLDEDEHCALIGEFVRHAAGRIPIIAGTGANATSEAVRLTRCAKQAGADACLLVTPYYNKPTQQGLYLHFRHIAEAVDIPQILYNVPGRTACDLLPETVMRLAQVPGIVGIKEASGQLQRVKQIRQSCGVDFAIYSGNDDIARTTIEEGGDGVISVTANVAPAAMHRMCRAALDGDRETALAIDRTLERLHHDLFLESNPIPVKWAMQQMGYIQPGIRLPLTWLDEDCQKPLREAMRLAGVFSGEGV